MKNIIGYRVFEILDNKPEVGDYVKCTSHVPFEGYGKIIYEEVEQARYYIVPIFEFSNIPDFLMKRINSNTITEYDLQDLDSYHWTVPCKYIKFYAKNLKELEKIVRQSRFDL